MYSTVGTPWVEDGLVLIPYTVLIRYLYGAYTLEKQPVHRDSFGLMRYLCVTCMVLVRFLYGTYAVLIRCLYGTYAVFVWAYMVLVWYLSGLDGLTDGGANGGQACRAFWQLCRRFRRAMKKEASGTIAKGLYVQMFGSVSNSVSGLSPQTF